MKFARMSLPTRGWEAEMCHVWSEVGSGFGEPGGTPTQEFPVVPPRAKRQNNFIVTLTLRDYLSFSFQGYTFI